MAKENIVTEVLGLKWPSFSDDVCVDLVACQKILKYSQEG